VAIKYETNSGTNAGSPWGSSVIFFSLWSEIEKKEEGKKKTYDTD